MFIYQPNTIDNAIALPGDVLPLIDVSNALPDAAALASVAVPEKVVAVHTPVTTAPLENVGEPLSSLFTISSTWIFDMSLWFLSIYVGYAMRTIPEPPLPPCPPGGLSLLAPPPPEPVFSNALAASVLLCHPPPLPAPA